MTVTTQTALLDTQHAFDGVAADYDRSNEANAVIRSMRARTIGALTARVGAGSRLLDLGCGPGRDAVTLGHRGYQVTAIDWSPAMVAETANRVAAEGLTASVETRHLGIHDLHRLAGREFDGAYSNLGPLNCVPDLSDVASALAPRLRPGGIFVASVIGRLCPWEVAIYAARFDWERVRIRFAEHFVRVPLEGRSVWMRYYWPHEFIAPFADAGFECVSLSALGLLMPPPYLDGFAGRHPALMRALGRLEDAVGRWPLVRHSGDHFLAVFRRTP